MPDRTSGVLELRWLAREPAMAVARIADRLGIPRPVDERLPLGEAAVRFVRDDEARAEGRLALVPVVGGTRSGGPVTGTDAGLGLAALGWATVDLDRAIREFAAALDIPVVSRAAFPDRLLGGAARIVDDPRLPGRRVILLEPSTEGRLAATLARDGEGPCAIYLAPGAGLDRWLADARHDRVAASRPEDGPIGRSALVLGGSVAGPHLIVVEPADLSSGA